MSVMVNFAAYFCKVQMMLNIFLWKILFQDLSDRKYLKSDEPPLLNGENVRGSGML